MGQHLDRLAAEQQGGDSAPSVRGHDNEIAAERVCGVDDGAVAGMSEVQLMRVTGHKDSKMLREYVEEAQLFETNTSALLGL